MTAPTDGESVADRDTVALPWGKEMLIQEVVYDTGLRLLRLRIREGRRFTVVDLDARAIARLRALTDGWTDVAEGEAEALDVDGG
ncbi:DUF6967 family protein [Azospirillum halopraeferens]|uniref:DUF6967 family protein n=1 Tax=Azospirillum halopraeferens TaxID=34010 RepID=UPI0003FE81F4|nr:hypothetical protein [Azospirillum halopraeferens]